MTNAQMALRVAFRSGCASGETDRLDLADRLVIWLDNKDKETFQKIRSMVNEANSPSSVNSQG